MRGKTGSLRPHRYRVDHSENQLSVSMPGLIRWLEWSPTLGTAREVPHGADRPGEPVHQLRAVAINHSKWLIYKDCSVHAVLSNHGERHRDVDPRLTLVGFEFPPSFRYSRCVVQSLSTIRSAAR